MLGVTQARDVFKEILDDVQFQGDKYIISRHGKPAIAIVPVEVYESWTKQRSRVMEIISEVQSANRDVDPDIVMRDVLEAQQAVRREKP